jgi:hypothetical protein
MARRDVGDVERDLLAVGAVGARGRQGGKALDVGARRRRRWESAANWAALRHLTPSPCD